MGQWSLFPRECFACRRKLPIPKHGPGRNQRFCSNACKMKCYRARKREAIIARGPAQNVT